MALALLIATGIAVCAAIQLVVPRYWFALFLSIVATMLAWIVISLLFAVATKEFIFGNGPLAGLEAFLGASLIAQVVAIFLKRLRR